MTHLVTELRDGLLVAPKDVGTVLDEARQGQRRNSGSALLDGNQTIPDASYLIVDSNQYRWRGHLISKDHLRLQQLTDELEQSEALRLCLPRGARRSSFSLPSASTFAVRVDLLRHLPAKAS